MQRSVSELPQRRPCLRNLPTNTGRLGFSGELSGRPTHSGKSGQRVWVLRSQLPAGSATICTQWKHYACGGKGFAIGFGPQLFGIEDKPNRKPHENVFVSHVRYGDEAARLQHRPAVESAVRIVLDTAGHKAKAMSDANRGMPFFREMAEELLASELILNCLITKGCKWAPEHEVRQFILGADCDACCACVSSAMPGRQACPIHQRRYAIASAGRHCRNSRWAGRAARCRGFCMLFARAISQRSAQHNPPINYTSLRTC